MKIFRLDAAQRTAPCSHHEDVLEVEAQRRDAVLARDDGYAAACEQISEALEQLEMEFGPSPVEDEAWILGLLNAALANLGRAAGPAQDDSGVVVRLPSRRDQP